MAVGMIAGGLLGMGTEAMKMNAQKKAQRRAEDRPKRRRLAKMQEAIGQAQNNRQRALIAIAQVHENYASRI